MYTDTVSLHSYTTHHTHGGEVKLAELFQKKEEFAEVRLPDHQHDGDAVHVGAGQAGGGEGPVGLPRGSAGTHRHKHQLQPKKMDENVVVTSNLDI